MKYLQAIFGHEARPFEIHMDNEKYYGKGVCCRGNGCRWCGVVGISEHRISIQGLVTWFNLKCMLLASVGGYSASHSIRTKIAVLASSSVLSYIAK